MTQRYGGLSGFSRPTMSDHVGGLIAAVCANHVSVNFRSGELLSFRANSC